MPDMRLRKHRLRFGQTMPEYALILAVITVTGIASVALFGQSFSDFFTNAATFIGGVNTA